MTYCDRECEQADGKFFCEKHGVWKNQKLAEACQLSDELRWMWENNCGPGQTPDGNPATAATKKTRKKCKGCGGNAFRLGWTFVKAQAKFAADGFQCVDQAEYDRRPSASIRPSMTAAGPSARRASI